jgi:hypothetical protein
VITLPRALSFPPTSVRYDAKVIMKKATVALVIFSVTSAFAQFVDTAPMELVTDAIRGIGAEAKQVVDRFASRGVRLVTAAEVVA